VATHSCSFRYAQRGGRRRRIGLKRLTERLRRRLKERLKRLKEWAERQEVG
jgi:hypothetical protein